MLDNCEVKSPRTNLRHVGDPKRISVAEMRPEQLGSIRYDWTPWDADQLRLMEAMWDEWAAFYKRFIPEGLARGINLGTHNGAIQKALMRAGFDMYGLEYTDNIAELHAYGCRGERGNFFHMPSIPTDAFDFAIIDRALCSNRLQSWNGEQGASQQRASIDIFTDFKGRERRDGPPFFDEAERIVRPGGVLIVSFRTYVSRLWIDDLAKRGRVSMSIDNRKHPYYVCTLHVGTDPKPIASLDEFVASAVKDRTLIKPDNRCARIRERGAEVSFLYVPDNRYVTISKDGSWRHVPLFEHPQDSRRR